MLNSIIDAVKENLTDDLRKDNRGHCYIASEAIYHLAGRKEAGMKPMNVRHEGEQHWFLLLPDDGIIDVTAHQFKTSVPYHLARGRGFLTKRPSKRAQELMDRVNASGR